MNNIVIVTCPKDWEQCSLLLKSIDTYLVDKSTIYLIWNDVMENTKHVPALPKLMNHNINWSSLDYFLKRDNIKLVHGWITQQVLKLAPGYFYNIDYVVLDSKNLLIKEVTLKELSQASPITHTMPRDFTSFYNVILKNMCVKDCYYRVLQPITPFHIHSKIVKLVLAEFNDDWDAFVDWFVKFDQPSEFILHDTFYQTHYGAREMPKPNTFSAFHNIYSYGSYLDRHVCINDYVKVISVHRCVWEVHEDVRAWANTLTQKD